MSFLDEFLSKPLPSATGVYSEGFLDTDDDDDDEKDLPGDVDDDDDEEDEPGVEDDMDRPESLELNPEEDAEADSIIDIAATPVLLNGILSQEAVREFVNSDEFDTAVMEGFACEGTKSQFTEAYDNELFMEAKFYQKNMVRMTKAARTNQLFEICVQAIARAKNDPVYFKLAKVQQIRRKLKAILRQRYKAPAMKKAKAYIMRMRNSQSATLAKAAAQIDK